MKKICLIISFIICLLCFVGCKNQNEVINPNVPDNPSQEQGGANLPEEGGNDTQGDDITSGEENLSGENTSDNTDAPSVSIPDDSENADTSDENEDVTTPDDELPEDGESEDIPGTTTSAISNSMTNIVTKAGAEVSFPMQDAIPAESSLGFIGLSEEDFNKYVTESVVYESMISPAFQSICIVKVNDSSKINDLKKSILDNSNPRKWICSSAEKVVVVDCGEYIMLAMSTEDLCNKLVTAFGEEIGQNLGETLTKDGEL